MPCIEYVPKRFGSSSMVAIQQANAICAEYAAQGYDLTLRQLYYQFVARDLIPNRDTEYKRLGSIINDARLAGELDWNYIVDRTRNLRELPHWNTPASMLDAASEQFRTDKWADQETRVEVWIEKDALVGVLESCCPQEDVPFFSCRGYTSQSEIWGAAQRLGEYIANEQRVVILHLGDHDPSGIDMTRDIRGRLSMFIAQDIFGQPHDEQWTYDEAVSEWLEVDRIALNRNQVDYYKPPPNPAKLTDSRSRGYVQRHGYSSWELDALEPTVLSNLIRGQIANYRDHDKWEAGVEAEQREREALKAAGEKWDAVRDFVA